MITFRLGPADLDNIRFAISPLFEVWQSIRALQNPGSEIVHVPWLADTRARVKDLDLSTLYALQPVRGYSPDFLYQAPTAPLVELEDQLRQVVQTSPDRIASEIASACRDTSVPALLQPFLEQPERAVADLVELVRVYWERAMAPHWERIRALLQGDVLYRARQAANGGARSLFADIDPTMRYADAALILNKPWDQTIELNGRGLLFVPSIFAWPGGLAVIAEGPWQPTIIYSARGSALLWEPPAGGPDALAALLGSRRAAVLASLDAPRSTTELASRLDLSASSVSQHLSVLRNAGLISRHRFGQTVLYGRSTTGEMLVNRHGAGSSAATLLNPQIATHP
jgi:DNA-binding transcriptional ArsR family regulator